MMFDLHISIPAPWDSTGGEGGGCKIRFQSEFQGFYYCIITVCYINKKNQKNESVLILKVLFFIIPFPLPLHTHHAHSNIYSVLSPCKRNDVNKKMFWGEC